MKYTEEDLKGMKRADLQKLCKNIGIKANMKTGKLLEEIVKYCNEEKENSKKENFMCIEGCVDVATKSTDIPSNFQQDEVKKQKIMTARSKIPRRTKQSARNAEQVKAPTKTPLASVEKRKNKRLTTPRDWAKIHQQQFEKMDSLDVYLSKKQQRAKDLFHSGKKVNVVKPLVDVDVPAKPSEVGLWKRG
ncbi:uncharacterized protein LOC124453139 [Xenia sp. Carnegie-2017]|uniref:uncharacterized protein LOC124453139 n=1 Tax=Xenia sp. Carnegie-2017 TaxID=2897299 RepID=UPI001F04AE42|nr:uncharacterized protein LOC124453139 [Xenia sp. Carnegie-2017]